MKTLKSTPTCFDHYSDHLQGVRRFIVKVTGFKFLKMQKVNCGDAAASPQLTFYIFKNLNPMTLTRNQRNP